MTADIKHKIQVLKALQTAADSLRGDGKQASGAKYSTEPLSAKVEATRDALQEALAAANTAAAQLLLAAEYNHTAPLPEAHQEGKHEGTCAQAPGAQDLITVSTL